MAVNYGELEVTTTLDGAVDGEIQEGAGEGTTNYNHLTHKPSINDIELIGNKTSADLGIATTLAELEDDEEHRTVTDTEKETWNNKSDFSGNYEDLNNKPFIPTELSELNEDNTHQTVTLAEKATWNAKADVSDIPDDLADLNEDSSHRTVTDAEKTEWNNKSTFSGSYTDLTNKPDIPDDLADLNEDTTHRLVTDAEKTAWNAKSDFSGSYTDLTNKPELKDLQDDSSHRTVTDAEKSAWDSKSDFSGSYNDLTDKPSIPDELADLDDVDISNPTNGQVLKYNSSTQKFENANESGGTVQNAYKSIKVADTTITASGEDTFELVAGSNITLTPDAQTKKITINSSGGGGGGGTGDMTKAVYDTNNDGIVNKADEAATLTGLNATVTELNALDGVTSNVQEQLNAKADSSDVPTALSDLSDDSTHRLVTDTEKTTWNGKSDFSGSYNDLTDKPSIPDDLADLNDDSTHRLVTDTEKSTWNAKSDFSGSYTDLTNKPTIPDAQVQVDWNENDNSKVDYIKNKPTIPDAQIQSDWNQSDNTKKDYIKNKPTIPSALADLSDDSTHRLVTDTEKTAWSAGEANVQSNWNETDTDSDAYIQNKPTIPSVVANPDNTTATLTSIGINGTNYAIQGSSGGAVDSVNGKTGVVVLDATDVGALPDSTPLFSGAYADLTGKPTLGTASALNVATSGDASTSEVVKGDDTRLTDSRNAKDVYSWAKESTKPSYAYSEIQNTPTLGTASAKDYVNSVVDGSSDLVTSDAVHDYVDSAISGVYKPSGNKTCAELLPSLLIASNLGNVYNMTDSGTTTADFVEGAGKPIEVGDNVVIVDVGTQNNASYKFDLLSGMVDLSNYIQKSATSGFIKNDGSIDTNTYATTSQIPDISGKADKSEMSVSTSGDQTTIQLKNGTSATVLNAHQSITGKADKVTNATENNFAALDANGNLKDSGHKHSDYLTQHQDISGKADKVDSATNGNLAGLNASGNLTDSTWSADKTTQSATGNPISISDLKSNQLAINPIITFEPIQAGSGTPSPSNVRAISGYDKVEVESCGKNIVQGIITGYNIASNGVISADTDYSLCYARVKANQKYTISDGASQSVYAFYFEKPKANATSYNDSRSVTTDHTFTSPIDGYVAFRIIINYGTAQLEEGETATTYEAPNKATSISESLGQTVYWGRWKPRTGEFEVLGGRVYLPDLSWAQYQSNLWISYSLNDVVGTAIYPKILPPDTNNDVVEAVCEKYQTDDVVTLMANQTTNIRIGANAEGTMFFAKGDGSENTPTGYMAYKLLEPFTIQLTPHEISLLKGYAYVSTNGTNIALDYHNGELASLSDVAQVGETVNGLLYGINKSGKFQLDSAWTGYVDLYKIGNLAFITMNIHLANGTNFAANTNYEIGSLPEGFTTYDTQFGAGIELGSSVTDICRVLVRNDNSRQVLVSTSSSAQYIQCTMIYPIV